MIPPTFDYVRPSTVADAVTALVDGGEDARPLAGGQSLLALLKLRLARPSLLVDLGNIPDLTAVSVRNDAFEIGAMVTHTQVLRATEIATGHQAFTDAGRVLGDRHIRNRGTLAGALVHADPAGDWLAVALALDLAVVVTNRVGSRALPVADLLDSAFTTTLAPGELVTTVRAPLADAGEASAYHKIADPASGYALAGTAASITLTDGAVAAARVAITGAGRFAQRLPAVERALLGGADPREAVAEIADELVIDETTADAEYRIQLAKVATCRAVEAALRRSSRVTAA